MELAGQWRREWAGTAEYGKVTEGGVTRRVARAMEVLNASAPGARVRVMRAAYHSTSGPGLPASSYMLHSSRRVISSGFDLLESPTYPSKPLEISSTPLESLPDASMGTENYKVTEPDDTEISEPSKWRSATNGNSFRMPSEESSSTENASIIDLDSRNSHKGLYRKYSYDSENSDVSSFRRSSSRTSPLLDAPVTLSTLKYKSLLNSSNDWNSRRKSYSFEDTSPINEIIVQSNDTLAMESSTDSGICKSSELVNDVTEDTRRRDIDFEKTHDNFNITGRSIDERQSKTNIYKSSAFKPYKERYLTEENNIALQSRGKVSITVPITIEDDESNLNDNLINDDGERKVKKVGFCKTELHFAADSGKVNIIATDEKPPSTNDFKKRRSAFVPINEKFEKPITLFGERSDFLETSKKVEYGVKSYETVDIEENTAATKSILKNRIPKPKPYLLGENMAFGNSDNIAPPDDHVTSTGVSIINKQLQIKRNNARNDEETAFNFHNTSDKSFRDSLRTTNKGPLKQESSINEKHSRVNGSITTDNKPQHSIQNNIKFLQMSPMQKAKTRQLRDSDLTYFGIDEKHKKAIPDTTKTNDSLQSLRSQTKYFDDAFESVRLIKQISNSAQNSEAESEESPDYQNLPMKNNFAPIPTPRSRVKYKDSEERVTILKPIIERANETAISPHESRRSRSKKQEIIFVPANRSISEPPKKKSESEHQNRRRDNSHQRCKDRKRIEDNVIKVTDDAIKSHHTIVGDDENIPLYANLLKDLQQQNSADNYHKNERRNSSLEYNKKDKINRHDIDSLKKRQSSSIKKSSRQQRTEKLSTPDHNTNHKNPDSPLISKTHKDDKSEFKKKYSSSSKKNQVGSHCTKTERPDKKDVEVDKTLSNVKSETLVSSNHRQKDSPNRISDTKKRSSHKNTDPIIIEHATKSKDLSKVVDRVPSDKNSLTNGRRTARRSEYVIKYDDKNGTVSSISKVRSGHGATKQSHHSKERNKNNSRDSKTKNKNVDASDLRK